MYSFNSSALSAAGSMEHHSIRQLRDKFGRFCAGPVLLAEGGDDPLAAAGEPIAAGGEDPLAAGGDPLAAGGDDLEVRSSSAISLNYVTEILCQFTI